MEAILVKVFATALALSLVMTQPDAVKTQFDPVQDKAEVLKILGAGCDHMRKAFDIENIELEVAKFLAIHTVDLMDDDALAELNEQARDPVVFELVAMKFARCVYGRLMQWLNFVLDLIEQSNTTEMRYVPEPRRNTGTNELSDIHYALLPKV